MPRLESFIAQLLGHSLSICFVMTLSAQTDPFPASKSWAIAVHGGAGGNASTWTEEKKQAKLDGIRSAMEKGIAVLQAGGSAMDAVEAAVVAMEDNPNFNAGRGAVLTSAGHVELDASIMDGSTLACGAVGCVTRIKNPVVLSRRIMEKTPHILLVGTGAEAYAESQGLPLVPNDYFLTAVTQRTQNTAERSPLSIDNDESHASRIGTVGCVALDSQGNLAAATSTGGLAKKLPGRVGDSPISGAGNYANNDTCAVSGTGIGEEFIRHNVAYDIAAQMRYGGRPLKESIADLFAKRLKPDTGGVIAVSKSGEIELFHNTPNMVCAAADSKGRFEAQLAVTQTDR